MSSSILQQFLSRPSPALLEIIVEEARGLTKGGAFSKTNPYCVIVVEDQVHRTAGRKNTTNPVWHERLTFRVHDLSSHALLQINIFDKGMRQDTLIGLVEVRLANLIDQHTREEWLPLFPSLSNLKSKTNAGEIRVFTQLLLTPMSHTLKLKRTPNLFLDSVLTQITLVGEIGMRQEEDKEGTQSPDSPQSPCGSPEPTRGVKSLQSPTRSPPISPIGSPNAFLRRETEDPPKALALLNELGGLPSTVVPTRANTCDILLFSSKNAFSYATKILTNSKWDHVALVVNYKGVLTVLEATSGAGVQVNHLDERLRNFLERGTRVGIRRFQASLSLEQKLPLWNFVNKMMGRPYEKNILEMAKAVVPVSTLSSSSNNLNFYNSSSSSSFSSSSSSTPGTGKPHDLSSVFCSELVAAALQEAGILRSEVNAGEFAPADFCSSVFDSHLQSGCAYSPLVVFGRRTRVETNQRRSRRSNSIDGGFDLSSSHPPFHF